MKKLILINQNTANVINGKISKVSKELYLTTITNKTTLISVKMLWKVVQELPNNIIVVKQAIEDQDIGVKA